MQKIVRPVTALALAFLIGLCLAKVNRRPLMPIAGTEESPSPSRTAARIPTNETKSGGQRSTPVMGWASVDSEDTVSLLRNLRAISCPEEIASRILGVRLRDSDSPHYAELGIAPPREPSRFGFSPEKQARVDEALTKFPKHTPSVWTQELVDEELARRKERIEYLQGHLSPEELLDYRIAEDGDTMGVARTVRGFEVTEAEFKKIFQVLDGVPISTVNGYFNPEVENQLRVALGENRYAEYHRQVGPGNSDFNNFVTVNRLEPDAAAKLHALRSQSPLMTREAYETEVTQLLRRPSLVRSYFMNRAISTPPASN